MKKNFLTRFFYKGKHHKKDEHDNLTAMLMPSVLGILLCAICLMGSTWAWFTATQSTATQTIQAASYTVTAEISAEDGTPVATGNTTLQNGTYTVKLTASGDATTGYAVVTVGKTEIYRGQLKPEETFSFTLVANEAATLEITYQWGTAAAPHSSIQDGTYTHGKAEEIPPADEKDETTDLPADTTEDNTTEETITTEPEPTLDPTQYTVQAGDSLGKIAKLYNTTVEILQAYNNIANANHIKVGDIIKIPPVDWKIPDTTTEESTPAETESTTEQTTPTTTEPSEDTESEA